MEQGPTPHVDGLDVLERIGGTRAQVHRAVVRASGRVVVVKHAPAHDVGTRAGLRREAGVLGRVRHPALQQLLDVHDDDRGTSLVLARHVGGDLAALLRDHGPLDTATVAALGARLARALAALHAVDVAHRDVRAANVLLDAGGRAVLADLDHALDPTAPTLATDAEVVGSSSHLDPRLLAGAPADARTDLHALAVTLWHAASGTLPRAAGDGRHTGPARPADAVAVDPVLVDVLQDVLDGDGGDARAVADRLGDLAGDVPGVVAAARLGPLPGVAPRTARQWPDDGDRTGDPTDAPGDGGPDDRGSDDRGPHDRAGDGLAAAWAVEEGTERFGAPALPVVARLRRRLPRWHVVVAATGLALVPLAALTVGRGGAAADDPSAAPVDTASDAAVGDAGPSGEDTATPTTTRPGTAADGATAHDTARPADPTGAGTGRAPTTTDRAVPVTPPPACPGAEVSPGAVLADLDGVGCGTALLHDPATGLLTGADGRRWQLGRPGDVLLAGDWDGDGRWSPGLHRPATGEVFLFPPLGDTEATSAPAQRWAPGGRAVVVADEDGHAVVVEHDDG